MSVTATMLRYAIAIGVAAFVAGFVGPVLFAPEANQGPMLGIFITGPLGFLAGGLIGLIVALMRSRQ